METCALCKPAHEHPNLIADTPAALVLLHEDWAVRGHVVVAAKQHVENLSELSEDDLADFMVTYRAVERAVLDATGADRAVVLKLGLLVPHVHLHIYPVSRTATRDDVMRAIEMKSRVEADPLLADDIRKRL